MRWTLEVSVCVLSTTTCLAMLTGSRILGPFYTKMGRYIEGEGIEWRVGGGEERLSRRGEPVKNE